MMIKASNFCGTARLCLNTLIGLFFCVLLAGCGDEAEVSEDKQSVVKHIERAQAYRDEGQYRAALIEAKNAVEKSRCSNFAMISDFSSTVNAMMASIECIVILEWVSDKSRPKILPTTPNWS